MDYRKIAIISSVAVLVLGGGIVGLIAWRARQLPPVVQSPSPPPVQGQTAPSNGGIGQSSGGNGAPAPAPTPADTGKPLTTVDSSVSVPACDTSVPQIDCDFDGLTNAQEAAAKTNPLKADTDGDGVTDGGEVLTYKSDPLNPRSIDPSMTDLEAINSGKRSSRQ